MGQEGGDGGAAQDERVQQGEVTGRVRQEGEATGHHGVRTHAAVTNKIKCFHDPYTRTSKERKLTSVCTL